MALCSVKNTERERNTGFPSYFTARSTRSTLSLIFSMSLAPPSLSLILHCTLCVLVFIQMFGFDWQFLLRLCTSGWLVSSAFCIPGKKGTESSGKRQQADGLCECVRVRACVCTRCMFFFLFFGFGSLTGPSAVAVWCLKDVSRSSFRQASPPLTY